MMTTGLPTLSQIQTWDTELLIDAADHWTATADRWDDVYGQVWQQSLGMDWEGQTRDALVERTTTDKTTVMGHSDQLREAAQTARKGAGDISAVQRSVLYKVDDAHQAGFLVGEDLSVMDTQPSSNAAELAARQAQAQALSADIRSRAGQLVAADTEVGTNLTGTAGDLGSLTFDEKPFTVDGKPYQVTADPRNGIQLVSHGFKTDGPGGGPAPTPQPDPPAIKLPPRTTMNTSPPIAMNPSNDPLPNCDGGEESVILGESTAGAIGIAGGLTATPFTLGAGLAPVAAGLAAVGDAIRRIGQCG
jgi:hypothetical protein